MIIVLKITRTLTVNRQRRTDMKKKEKKKVTFSSSETNRSIPGRKIVTIHSVALKDDQITSSEETIVNGMHSRPQLYIRLWRLYRQLGRGRGGDIGANRLLYQTGQPHWCNG